KFRRHWSAFTIMSGTLMVLFFAVSQWFLITSTSPKVMGWMTFIVVFIIIVGAVILSIMTGQGGSRSRVKVSGENGKQTINRDEDRYWKLGIFYMNRKDPSI